MGRERLGLYLAMIPDISDENRPVTLNALAPKILGATGVRVQKSGGELEIIVFGDQIRHSMMG